MRFFLILCAIVLLPALVLVHTLTFKQCRQPRLAEKALRVMLDHRIASPAAEVQFFDLSVRGEASDSAARMAVTAALSDLHPLRLVENRLVVPATLKARLEGEVLHVSGDVPTDKDRLAILEILRHVRPDLKLDSAGLVVSEWVRWPQGVTTPLTEETSFIHPILQGLKVPPRLEIRREGDALRLSGVLPSPALRDSVLKAVQQPKMLLKVQADDLRVSSAVQAATFTETGPLTAFLQSYYQGSTPDLFAIEGSGSPRLKASATPPLQAQWLRLLRDLSGGEKVEADWTFYPSPYHLPDYRRQTVMETGMLTRVREALAATVISFVPGSADLTELERSRLALLTPTLLTAGPALRLVIGGHSGAGGDGAAEKRLAQARADAVLSFLIEQGVPSSDIQAVALDAVPENPMADQVEILIK